MTKKNKVRNLQTEKEKQLDFEHTSECGSKTGVRDYVKMCTWRWKG